MNLFNELVVRTLPLELRRQLVPPGHRLRVYVPYGEAWEAYSMRRLKENPVIAGHVLKGMFVGR